MNNTQRGPGIGTSVIITLPVNLRDAARRHQVVTREWVIAMLLAVVFVNHLFAYSGTAFFDSQIARTANGGEQISIDGHRRNNGCERHLLTDTLGNILAVTVTAANESDVAGGGQVLGRLNRQWQGQATRLKTILADKAYGSLTVVILVMYGWLIKTPADRKYKWKGFVV